MVTCPKLEFGPCNSLTPSCYTRDMSFKNLWASFLLQKTDVRNFPSQHLTLTSVSVLL
jgi:hypothetical protein